MKIITALLAISVAGTSAAHGTCTQQMLNGKWRLYMTGTPIVGGGLHTFVCKMTVVPSGAARDVACHSLPEQGEFTIGPGSFEVRPNCTVRGTFRPKGDNYTYGLEGSLLPGFATGIAEQVFESGDTRRFSFSMAKH